MIFKIEETYKNMAEQTHLLIAGSTGSGKSTVLHGLIYHLLARPNDKTAIFLLDVKQVEMARYARIPYVYYRNTVSGMVSALGAEVSEMRRRLKSMLSRGLTSWDGVHDWIVVDDFPQFLSRCGKNSEEMLCEISELGRAAGIHLVLATQRPTRDVICGRLAVNIDSRVALRVPTAQDSRNIIHMNGAENLPRYGHGFYLTPETMTPVLCELAKLDDDDIQRMIEFREQAPVKSIFPSPLARIKNALLERIQRAAEVKI